MDKKDLAQEVIWGGAREYDICMVLLRHVVWQMLGRKWENPDGYHMLTYMRFYFIAAYRN